MDTEKLVEAAKPAVDQILDKMLLYLEQTEIVAAEHLPLLAQEILRWGVIVNLTYAALWGVIVAVIVWQAPKLWRIATDNIEGIREQYKDSPKWQRRQAVENWVIARVAGTGAVAGVFTVFGLGVIYRLLGAVKAVVAPRMYLIEYIGNFTE